MNLLRRGLLSASLAASLAATLACTGPAALAQTTASAQAFPSKPVTLVTAFAPGSGPDAVLRLVAEKLGRNPAWNGQRIVVDGPSQDDGPDERRQRREGRARR